MKSSKQPKQTMLSPEVMLEQDNVADADVFQA